MNFARRSFFTLLALGIWACSSSDSAPSEDAAVGDGGIDAPFVDSGTPLPSAATVVASFTPDSADVVGLQRVNFAIPLARGQLSDAKLVRVTDTSEKEFASAVRVLAKHADGSIRSLQLQLEIDIAATKSARITIGSARAIPDLALASVESTLRDPSGEAGPKVYVTLPPEWLSASGVVGPMVPAASVTRSELKTWSTLCDYSKFDTKAFLSQGYATTRAVWLYDRGTAFYRGYAHTGDLVPLRSAYRETSMARNRITGKGKAARNGLPEGASTDVKYQYAQNLAIHYLLTGDDRFRESAEDMALGMSALWPDPGYAGGNDAWTERSAGFALLAYVWAAMVSDDQRDAIMKEADRAVDAYVALQEKYPVGYSDAEHRCFAHHGNAHDPDEGNPYFGCSPWMSAILADGLDAYQRETDATRAGTVKTSLIKLGRMIARDGRDKTNRPYYWMGAGTEQDDPDEYDEHVGESAYVVAMARHFVGTADAQLDGALAALLAKFAADGEAGQLRSFNWQCRSAIATPYFAR